MKRAKATPCEKKLPLLCACSILLACGQEPSASSARVHTAGCEVPAGTSNRPSTIEASVALANALPRPLTLPCYLEALARPLPLHASLSVFSAQPARGAGSPRIFINFEPLIMTVVPTGIGAHLLEFGEQRAEHRSLKGELTFPLHEPVAPGEVYQHILFSEEVSSCASCHASEQLDTSVPGGRGFVSQTLRPHHGERVSLDLVRASHGTCDAETEPDRCAMLDALFGWGEVVDWEFPSEIATLD